MFKKYLINLLKEMDITQTALAKNTGVTRSAVCLWIKGNRHPNIKVIKQMIEYISQETKRSKRVITHEIMSAIFADLETVQ